MTGFGNAWAIGCASSNTHKKEFIMKKHLLATTAAIALIATPMAMAQNADNATPATSSVFSQERNENMAPVDGFYAADPSQILATRFIGAYIYNGTGEDAETVGDVNDIIMTQDGRAVAVIAGIGGFLGIGEKEVAVSMDQLQWTTDADGDQILVGQFSKEQLEAAPAFERDNIENRKTAVMEGQQVPANEQTAEAEQPATETMEQTAEAKQPTDETTTASTPRMETVTAADAKLEATEIIGMSVTGADGEEVGEVSEILIGDSGEVEAVLIDVGGFLGMNEKPVAVSFNELQIARAEGSKDWTTIKTGLTAEALEEHKAYNKSEYEADKEAVILVAPVQ
ncbi:PRC-barrel domain containing protein [Oricola cellulosilytica]|uniref:PRC-barrel domain containing protein n=2 Tax=Oricola cellulosilytica TaxID=1429082 RepID=A0A4R0PCA2_9HYPH|nr:PRC-barrel domain containing protein [Oricola cellulosilytica]